MARADAHPSPVEHSLGRALIKKARALEHQRSGRRSSTVTVRVPDSCVLRCPVRGVSIEQIDVLWTAPICGCDRGLLGARAPDLVLTVGRDTSLVGLGHATFPARARSRSGGLGQVGLIGVPGGGGIRVWWPEVFDSQRGRRLQSARLPPWAVCAGLVWRQGDAGEECTQSVRPRWTTRPGDGSECRVEFRELAVQPEPEETDRKVRTEP